MLPARKTALKMLPRTEQLGRAYQYGPRLWVVRLCQPGRRLTQVLPGPARRLMLSLPGLLRRLMQEFPEPEPRQMGPVPPLQRRLQHPSGRNISLRWMRKRQNCQKALRRHTAHQRRQIMHLRVQPIPQKLRFGSSIHRQAILRPKRLWIQQLGRRAVRQQAVHQRLGRRTVRQQVVHQRLGQRAVRQQLARQRRQMETRPQQVLLQFRSGSSMHPPVPLWLRLLRIRLRPGQQAQMPGIAVTMGQAARLAR